MDRDNWKNVLLKKPAFFVVVSLVYLVFVGFLKWRFAPPVTSLWYLAGGILGIYFLDIAEVFFHLSPSPFRSVVFAAAFAGVSFFVVSSSGSNIATGLVLSLYLTLILWQIGEWQIHGNLSGWYQMVAGPVAEATQRWILLAFIGLFFIESFLFIR